MKIDHTLSFNASKNSIGILIFNVLMKYHLGKSYLPLSTKSVNKYINKNNQKLIYDKYRENYFCINQMCMINRI